MPPGAYPHKKQETCPHNSIQKKRGNHEVNLYVCGSCAAEFDVKLIEKPKPVAQEPMFNMKLPWGLRDRQA